MLILASLSGSEYCSAHILCPTCLHSGRRTRLKVSFHKVIYHIHEPKGRASIVLSPVYVSLTVQHPILMLFLSTSLSW